MSSVVEDNIGFHINNARRWLLIYSDTLTEEHKNSLALVIGYASMTLSLSKDVNN